MPDHSTLSKSRHGRFRESRVFRWLFDELVRRCMAAGLVKGEGFAVGASIVAADASSQRAIDGDQAVVWKVPAPSTRAVREYLQALDANELSTVSPKKLSLTDPLCWRRPKIDPRGREINSHGCPLTALDSRLSMTEGDKRGIRVDHGLTPGESAVGFWH